MNGKVFYLQILKIYLEFCIVMKLVIPIKTYANANPIGK